MSKAIRDLLDLKNTKQEEIKALLAENKLDEAEAIVNDIKDIDRKVNLQSIISDKEEEEVKNKVEDIKVKDVKKDSIKAFAEAARKGFRVNNSMNEGTGLDGGYTVPEDILTMINKYKEAKASLKDLVRVEKVTTNKGQRTFKKRSQQTGFTKVGEGAAIGAKATPQFERLAYEIEKYAGYFPVTNEVLADSDANLTNALIEWIADESRVTQNKLILAEVAKLTPVELKSIDDIKKALNVTLGQAFKATSKIVTNDDGLQYLDTLKDSEGKYLLQPNPADPMQMRLCAGATTVAVEVYPNADMPTNAGKIPFVIGDLNEAVVFWDRQQMNIKMSDIAAIGDLNAFEEDLTLFRAIEREDVTLRDSQAVVNGFITVTP